MFLSGSGLEGESLEDGATTSVCQIMQTDPTTGFDARQVCSAARGMRVGCELWKSGQGQGQGQGQLVP